MKKQFTVSMDLTVEVDEVCCDPETDLEIFLEYIVLPEIDKIIEVQNVQAKEIYDPAAENVPEEIEESLNGAKSIYRGHSKGNGMIHVEWWTNDDLDHGVPTKEARDEWDCKDRAEFDRLCGVSRIGCIGTIVDVFLDGQKV